MSKEVAREVMNRKILKDLFENCKISVRIKAFKIRLVQCYELNWIDKKVLYRDSYLTQFQKWSCHKSQELVDKK